MADEMEVDRETNQSTDKMFTLKKWNLVAMWSWDVECDTCAICRVQVMGKCVNNKFLLLQFMLQSTTVLQLQYIYIDDQWLVEKFFTAFVN